MAEGGGSGQGRVAGQVSFLKAFAAARGSGPTRAGRGGYFPALISSIPDNTTVNDVSPPAAASSISAVKIVSNTVGDIDDHMGNIDRMMTVRLKQQEWRAMIMKKQGERLSVVEKEKQQTKKSKLEERVLNQRLPDSTYDSPEMQTETSSSAANSKIELAIQNQVEKALDYWNDLDLMQSGRLAVKELPKLATWTWRSFDPEHSCSEVLEVHSFTRCPNNCPCT